MKDQFGRELTYLRISVVDRCNLRCLYCMPAHGAGFETWDDLLSYEEMVKLVEYFSELGIRKVRITGGEPLVRKDIAELMFRIKEIPGIHELALSTNGVFLKGQVQKLQAAGLDRINISLDTLNRNRFLQIARLDRLSEVLDGIEEAVASGLHPIKINTVLMKGINEDEILDLVRFAIDKSIEVRFIELMATNGLVQLDPQERFFSTEEAKERIEREYELIPLDSYFSSPAQVFSIMGTKARIGFISPISNYFCARCNRLRLKANGMLKTCLHGKEDLDLKALLRSGASAEEIKRRIQEVVWVRPEQHFLNELQMKHQDFQMSHVGG
ncbi:MAG: cyclic pyranopterin phosphate synthase MoaA [Omnitrophica bacterium RIFCSPHIGHO2_02_FULL_46_11]|nr:MAG: cyclic pyranopterin phosphate synthase MoaA [Omnitrophica bacterium RIFCSPHIGHO2_02_FULL_46_11]OGW87526.1 MAG: cyclic pyranopterin phosphate synthase MoaA [Omnitrophica bacterium RIFCSPLOWO2_01_FULL_45_10b]